ncbi:MAG: type II toxin-antitoxin system HipA family toxin [Moraxellaceae bacterium]|nr:type II toxin-antitoxin system HipA family toxin [Moraxellaceae bacterium]
MTRAYIYMQSPGEAGLVTLGRLVVKEGVGEFVYSPDHVQRKGWVPDSIHYPLRPEPYAGIVSNNGLPGFIRDAAPDGWGERVIAYGEASSLSGIDYLIRSSNVDRAGSLLIGTTRKPSVMGQPDRLDRLDSFIAFMDGIQSGERLAPETARAARQRSSLGGLRPKVTLLDEGRVIVAKPRDRHDKEDIPAIEHACMTFAARKGLNVARTRLHAGKASVLLVDRFDRVATGEGGFLRLPMLSAATLLDVDWRAVDEISRARWRYAEMADEMRRKGVPVADLQELYKRMCYNALIGNDDDHPKNHAVLFQRGQWRLSPLYDVVPALDGAPPPMLAMAVGQQGRVISRENLLSHAAHFGLSQEGAAVALDEVAGWESELKAHYRSVLLPPLAERVIRSVDAGRLRV